MSSTAPDTTRLPVGEAMALLGLSESGLRKKAKKEGWERTYDDSKRAYVTIPNQVINPPQKQSAGHVPHYSEHTTAPVPHHDVDNTAPVKEEVPDWARTILESHAAFMAVATQIIERDRNLPAVNNQLEAAQEKIKELRDKNRTLENQVQDLSGTVQHLQKQVQDLTQKSHWWKFWA